MAWTKIRSSIATLTALLLVILVGSAGSAIFGWNLPLLHQIGLALGLGQ